MSDFARRAAWRYRAGLCLAVSLLSLLATPLAAAEDAPPRPEESPEGAQEYFRARRAPVGETAIPVERYVAALEQMRRMPQHSMARNAFLPSRAELEAKGLSYVFDAASLGAWTPLGPGNVGGRTRALVIDPRIPT